MPSIVDDVKRYLWRRGWADDQTVDPVELLQRLLDAYQAVDRAPDAVDHQMPLRHGAHRA